MGARQDRKNRKAEKQKEDLQNNVEELNNFIHKHIDTIKNEERRAKAPYNFVSLNTKVIVSDFDISKVEFNKYYIERNTGYIELNIKTETPMYIRDNKNIEHSEDYINPDFFSPAGGKLRIPGSSMRGMLRSLVEIVSFGKFGSFDDKSLYYRAFDKSSLRIEYQKFGLSSFENGKVKYQMKTGVLRKTGNQYFILETGSPKQIKKEEARIAIGNGYSEFKFFEVGNEYIVVSGDMQNKKNDWIVNKSDDKSKKISLSNEDIRDYKNDENRNYKDTENRNKKTNIIEKLKTLTEVPCFYIQWHDNKGNVRIIFGHTGMFRVPYRKTIGEHIPEFLKKETDFAEVIFGNETKFAGRVFVEDSFCENDNKIEILVGETPPKILSGPKPTTFQHYLTQKSEDVKELKHYNPDSMENCLPSEEINSIGINRTIMIGLRENR